jgi:hypothetical protein
MSKQITFVFILVTLMLVPILSAGTIDQQPCQDPCGKATAWQEFNSFSLKITSQGQPDSSKYQGGFDDDTGDIDIDVEISQAGTTKHGKIMMIGGRIMATQGPITEPGYEIDALNGAILQLQLVTKLLGRAVPDGPTTIKSSQHLDYADSKTGVQIATPSADGMIPAPWRVIGELKKRQDDGVEFDLTLSFPSRENKATTTMAFSGKLFNAVNTKIDDQMELTSWNLFGIGPQSRNQGDATIIDYSAAPEASTYKTVADVRKTIAADDYPGEPDTSKDFTGFWKTNCDDAFGLQIKHYGKEGKYAIVFCGPGGCGDPENEGRKTFISKDPHYQVITEEEVKERTSSGWETYHRCTKETSPILKYKDSQ